MSKRGVNMVTKDEQTEFFKTIFAPLEKKSTPQEIKNAKNTAFEFVKGVTFEDIDNDIFDQWDLIALSKQKADSWKWLIAMRQKYPVFNENKHVRIHKFVWHKKPNEVDWGPKLVTEIMGGDQHKFLYVTKPMDEAKIELIKTVGSTFNLFQPVQQGFSHDVSVEQEKDFTKIIVLADNGETLEKEFESIIKNLEIQSMDTLFQKIIDLYLQSEIGDWPSLGMVAPVKHGKEWKYGYMWADENPQLEFLRDFEKTAPFIVPLRSEKGEHTQYMTLLHGDEWGGNFMAPPSIGGSIRPIDFEDAHIQRVEVKLDDQKNIVDYLKPSEDPESHKTAGGILAYRFTSYRTGEAPPLYAYSAMSALGRLFAALVQKQTLKTNPQETDKWIEEATARFFNNLRNSLNTFISSAKGEKYLTSLDLDPEITQRGLMVRAVLAAYNWSEHWKYKTRDNDDHAECFFEGKWKKSSLEEFQFRLGVQGEWEVCSRDSKGRPTTIGHDYAKVLRNEIDTYNDWTEVEQTDILKAISLLEDYGNNGVRLRNKEYFELSYLYNLLPFEKGLNDVVFERRIESTKHERLENKIDFINAHFILKKEESGTTKGTPAYNYLIRCIDEYPIDEHWKDIWLFWRDIYDWVGMELKPEADKLWTMQVNFDAQIHGEGGNRLVEIINTFETGTLLERDQQASERNLILTKHIAYLNSFRTRIFLSSGEDSSILLDSIIARFCSTLGELILDNLSEMDYTDLNFLTNLIRLANDGDREFVETKLVFDVPLFVLFTFAELGFDNKTKEIEQFFDALSQSVGKCFTVCANIKIKNDEEDYNFLMECMLRIISHPKQQLLRAWAIEFIDRLNPHTQRILEDVPWYKLWKSL
jgi:hypothetical protein